MGAQIRCFLLTLIYCFYFGLFRLTFMVHFFCHEQNFIFKHDFIILIVYFLKPIQEVPKLAHDTANAEIIKTHNERCYTSKEMMDLNEYFKLWTELVSLTSGQTIFRFTTRCNAQIKQRLMASINRRGLELSKWHSIFFIQIYTYHRNIAHHISKCYIKKSL